MSSSFLNEATIPDSDFYRRRRARTEKPVGELTKIIAFLVDSDEQSAEFSVPPPNRNQQVWKRSSVESKKAKLPPFLAVSSNLLAENTMIPDIVPSRGIPEFPAISPSAMPATLPPSAVATTLPPIAIPATPTPSAVASTLPPIAMVPTPALDEMATTPMIPVVAAMKGGEKQALTPIRPLNVNRLAFGIGGLVIAFVACTFMSSYFLKVGIPPVFKIVFPCAIAAAVATWVVLGLLGRYTWIAPLAAGVGVCLMVGAPGPGVAILFGSLAILVVGREAQSQFFAQS